MGRPSCCCSNCYSIWAIDTNDGRVLWKKNFGYIYSVSEYGEYVFILTSHEGEYQVICLQKSSGARVTEKSFIVHYQPQQGQVYALDADNIFVYSSRPEWGFLFRYVNQVLENFYRFTSPYYKIVNDRLIGYGGYDEDYHYYLEAEDTDDRITFNFREVLNVDTFVLHFRLIHEKYNLTLDLGTDGRIDIDLNSSEDNLIVDDIIDSIDYSGSHISVIFKPGLESKLDNIFTFQTEVNFLTVITTYSIYNRLFGQIPSNYIPPLFRRQFITDGLNNRVEASVQGIAFAFIVENVYNSHGEMFNVLCQGNGPITLPSLIEIFNLIDLSYERKTFTDNNTDAVDFSYSMLNKYWYMKELNPSYDTFEYQLYQSSGPFYVYTPLYNLLSGKKIKREYTRDDTAKFSYNRDYSYGVNMPLEDSNGSTRSPVSPYSPVTSTPLDTISTYVNVNSANSLYFFRDIQLPYGQFINANNSLNEGVIKNICSAVRVSNIHYDEVQDKYLLNCEKLVHWVYLRNQYLSYGIMQGAVLTEDVLVSSNALGISPQYVDINVTNGNMDWGQPVLYYPNNPGGLIGGIGNPIDPNGYNFGFDFNDYPQWYYIITKNQPESRYVAGYFSIHDKQSNRYTTLTNMYGFYVRVDQSTGIEYGRHYEAERVWHKFTDIVYHFVSQDQLGLIDYRMVYTSPVSLEMITENFDSYTSNFREPIQPFKVIPLSNDTTDYLDATMGSPLESISDGGTTRYELANDFGLELNPEINQPKQLPLDKLFLSNSDGNNYGIMDFSLSENDIDATPRQRINSKSDINLEYFKQKTKLLYDENYNQEFTNNQITKITNDTNKSYIYYKSLDGALTSQIDIYHIRYNRNQSEVSTICPFLVFHPIDAYDLQNGQANVIITLKNVTLVNGVKTYDIRRIEKDIDLMNGDMSPVLDALNANSSGGTFEFLGGNTNIKNDYVFMILDNPSSSVTMFSGQRELTTIPVSISSAAYDGILIDNTYFYSAT